MEIGALYLIRTTEDGVWRGYFLYEKDGYVCFEMDDDDHTVFSYLKQNLCCLEKLKEAAPIEHQLLSLSRFLPADNPVWEKEIVFVGTPDNVTGLGHIWVRNGYDSLEIVELYDSDKTISPDLDSLQVGAEYLLASGKYNNVTKTIFLGKSNFLCGSGAPMFNWFLGSNIISLLASDMYAIKLLQEPKDLSRHIKVEGSFPSGTPVFAWENLGHLNICCVDEDTQEISWWNYSKYTLPKVFGVYGGKVYFGNILNPKAHLVKPKQEFSSPCCPFPLFVDKIIDGQVYMVALPDEEWEYCVQPKSKPTVADPEGDVFQDFDCVKVERRWFLDSLVEKVDDSTRFLSNLDYISRILYCKDYKNGMVEIIRESRFNPGSLARVKFFYKGLQIGDISADPWYESGDTLICFGDLIEVKTEDTLTKGYLLSVERGFLKMLDKDEKQIWLPLNSVTSISRLVDRGCEPIELANGLAYSLGRSDLAERNYVKVIRKQKEGLERSI